jgi:hypothetical protein
MLSNKLLTTSTEVVPDAPQMNYVTALLHADGTNGAQNNTFINQTLPLGAGYNVGYFDGTGDYLSITDNGAFDFGTGAFTVEAWVMPMSFPTDDNSIVAGIGPTNGDWMLAMTSASDVRWGRNHIAWDLITAGVTFVANTWYHIAVCKTGSTLRIYVDGIQRASASNTQSYNIANSTLAVGARQLTGGVLGAGNFFDGYISNLRILKGVALYTANFAVPTSPLTAITGTSLLTCNNTTFTDSSSNNFTVTANGNASVVNLLQTLTRNGDTTQGSFSPYGDLWSNYFDGNGDFLTVPDSNALDLGTGDFTIECFVYPTGGSSQYPRILAKGTYGQAGSWAIAIDYNDMSINFEYGIAPSYVKTIGLSLNNWNHCAVVRVGTTVTVYLNGVAGGTATVTNDFTNTNILYIGRANVAFDYLQGYISDARIVKGTAVYTANFTLPTAPLTAVSGTSLLTCQSNRLLDASSNNFAITRNGDVKVTKFSPFIPTSSYDPVVLGGSAYLDGTGDYLSLANNELSNFGTGNFTIEGWFFFTNANANALQAMFSNYTTYAVAGSMYWGKHTNSTSGRMSVWIYNQAPTTFYIQEPSMPPQDQWTHYALVRNGNTITIYRNGIATVSASTFSGTTTVGNRPLYIGVAGDSLSTSGFPGYISNYRIVKGTALYTANFTPPTAPLLPITNTSLLLSATNAGIFDSTVKGNWETEGTAQLSTSVKKFGTASLYFDGSSTSRLFTPYSINHVFGSGNFTIEYWCYPTLVTSATRRHISMEEANHTFIIRQNGTLMQIVFRFGSSTVVSANASVNFTLNTWQHVALVRNGNSFVLYKDGVSVASLTNSGSINQTTAAILVGGSVGNESFQGYMDEVRITKGIARYTANFTPPTEPFADY